jgi:pyruvate dehydrogenase E2 component (dihydrolipoamide acetyltransferase)
VEVKKGQELLEIETDKSTVEIEAPQSGTLGRIVAAAGQTVAVGTVIAYLLAQGETIAAAPGGAPSTTANAVEPDATAPKVRASPAARHLARKLNVDLTQLSGTGPGGRVVAWNVQGVAAPSAPLPPAAKDSAEKPASPESTPPTARPAMPPKQPNDKPAAAPAPVRPTPAVQPARPGQPATKTAASARPASRLSWRQATRNEEHSRTSMPDSASHIPHSKFHGGGIAA